MQHCPGRIELIFQHYEWRHHHKWPAFTAKSWTNSSLCTIAWKIGLRQQLSCCCLVYVTCLSGSESSLTSFFKLFCAHALQSRVWRRMEDLFRALCVKSIVVPSLIKCGCPDYPAVRHRSKWEEGGEGGHENEMLTDPAAITNHQSNLISWLTEWVCGFGAHEASAPGSEALATLTQAGPGRQYTRAW